MLAGVVSLAGAAAAGTKRRTISPRTVERAASVCADFGDGAAQELLVQLSQLARDDDVLRWAEDRLDVGERGQDAVRGFVENLDPGVHSTPRSQNRDLGHAAAFARDDSVL